MLIIKVCFTQRRIVPISTGSRDQYLSPQEQQKSLDNLLRFVEDERKISQQTRQFGSTQQSTSPPRQQYDLHQTPLARQDPIVPRRKYLQPKQKAASTSNERRFESTPPSSNTPQPLQVRAIPINSSQGSPVGSGDVNTELKTFSPQHRFFGSRPGALRVSSAKTAPFKSHPTEKTVELDGIKVPIMSQMVKNHHVNLLPEDEFSTPDNMPVQLDGVQVPSKSKMIKNHHVNLLPNYEHHISENKISPTSFNQPDQSLSTARRPTATTTARRPIGASKSYSKPAEITPVKSSVVQGFRVRGDTSNRIVFLNVDELGFNVDAGSLKLGNSELIPVDGLTSFADAEESDKGQGSMTKDAVDKMVSTHLQHDSSIHEPAELLNIQDTRQFFGAHSTSIPKSSKQSNYRPAPDATYRPARPSSKASYRPASQLAPDATYRPARPSSEASYRPASQLAPDSTYRPARPSSEASYRPASQQAPDSTYRPAQPPSEASYRPASRPESEFTHRPARPAVGGATFQPTLTAAEPSYHATSPLNRPAEILSSHLSVKKPKQVIKHKPPKIFFGKTAYTERGHVQDSSQKQSTEQFKSSRRQHSSSSKVSFSSFPSRSSTQNSLPKAIPKSTTPDQRQSTPEQPKKVAQSQFSSFINSPSNQEQSNQYLPTSQQSLSNKSTHRNPQQSLHQPPNQQPQKTSYKQQQPQKSTYNLPEQSAYQQPQQSNYQQQSTYQQQQPQQSTYQQQQPQQSTYQQQKSQQAGVEEVLRQQAAVVQLQQQHATLTQNPYSQPNHFLHAPQQQPQYTPQVPGLQQQQQQIQELLATQLQQQVPQAPHFLPAQHPSVQPLHYQSNSPKHAAGLSQHAHYVSQLQAAQQALG